MGASTESAAPAAVVAAGAGVPTKAGDSGMCSSSSSNNTGRAILKRISARHQPVAVPSPPSAITSTACDAMIESAFATPISASSLPRCELGANSAM